VSGLDGSATGGGAEGPTLRSLRSLAGHGLVRNFAALVSAEAVARVASIVSVALIARIVGPVVMGSFALAQGLAAFANMFGDGGISILAQRKIAARPEQASAVATIATVAQVGLGSVTLVIFVVLAAILPIPDATTRLLLVLLPVLLAQAFSLVYVLQGLERMNDVAAVKVVTQVTSAAFGLVGVSVTGDILWAAIAAPVGIVAGDVVCAAILWRRYRLRPSPFRLTAMTEMAREGRPFLGITLLTQVLLQLDVIVLGFLSQPAEVGFYAAAYRLVLFVLTLSGLLSQAAFAQLVRRYEEHMSMFQRLLRMLIRLAAHFTLPVTALFLVEAPSIVRAVFGAEFAASSDIMRVLALWIPLGFYNNVVAGGMVAAGFQRAYLAIVAVAAVLSVTLLVVLVPQFGGLGAAAAVVGREVVLLMAFSFVSLRYLKTATIAIFAGQILWFVVPLGCLLALNAVLPNLSLFVSLGVTLLSVVVIEWSGGWRLYRELLGGSDTMG